MGRRKADSARLRKEVRAGRAIAILRNCPLSPRKVRLVADMVRGKEVNRALAELRYAPQGGALYVEKLLMSALANWGQKNADKRVEDESLFVNTIMVDEGRMLKRLRPRAQGRANRILKRFCHITIEVGAKAVEDVNKKASHTTKDAVEAVTE